MTEDEKYKYEGRAAILKAIAHPSRIFIVDKLSEKPYCVCELAEMIGIDQSTASKHLSILKNAGLIDDNKKGTTVYYSLRCRCILDFLWCIEDVIRMNLERSTRYLYPEKDIIKEKNGRLRRSSKVGNKL